MDAVLAKDAPVPLWRQLKIILREKALSELQPGDKIPTEPELCELYGVSRVTVRQAVASLVREGILARQWGRGTYVLPPKLAEQMDSRPEPARESTHRIVLYSAEHVSADRRLAGKLAVPVGEPLHKIRRLRTVGDEPISYITIYLPMRLFPDLTLPELESESLARMLAFKSGLSAEQGEETIEFIQADHFRSELLHTPIGSPLLVVETTARLGSGEIVEFSRAYHRADRSRLTRTVTGSQLHSRGW